MEWSRDLDLDSLISRQIVGHLLKKWRKLYLIIYMNSNML